MTARTDALTAESDEALATQARSGDRLAFEQLCDRYLPVIYQRLRMKLPPGAVDDVAQEVFLAATRGIRRFRGQAGFSTWILRIAQHKIADYYRGNGRRPETVPLDPDLAPGADSEKWQDTVALRTALARLPAHYQVILLLRFSEGLPFGEIAARLGISLEAAKSRYRRAVVAIAKVLDVE